METKEHDRELSEQIEYYQARAGEYDEWFLRRGRYDRGTELNRRWFDETAVVQRALDLFQPGGDVLELACGTGLWTARLLQHAASITAIDAAAEVLELNRRRTQSPRVKYLLADLFNWKADKQYDVVFFSFWLSYVPPERFEAFRKLAADALKPGGRVFFIDSQYDSTSTAKDHQLTEKQSTRAVRKLNEGRQFQIVKVFYDIAELSGRLKELGWNCMVETTENYFFYGYGERA
jgi:ubiquinone/menaquinone biosynthesis C-methylase UbiE